METTSSGPDSHPHANQVKPSHVANIIGMKMVKSYAILGADRSVKGKDWRNQSNRKVFQEPSFMVRRRMLGTIIVSGHMDIKTLYTRTEKRAEDRNLRGSGLRRAVSVINGLFSGLLGRRRSMRGRWVRRRGFLFLACCTDFRRGSWSMSSSSDSSRRLRRAWEELIF